MRAIHPHPPIDHLHKTVLQQGPCPSEPYSVSVGRRRKIKVLMCFYFVIVEEDDEEEGLSSSDDEDSD